MTITAPPSLTAPPSPPPTRADPTSFAARGDAYHTWRITNHSEEVAALSWSYATVLETYNLATAAQNDRILVQQARAAIDAQSPVANAAAAAASATAAQMYASQAQAVSPDSPIRLNTNRIKESFTIPDGHNASTVGPFEVGPDVVVTGLGNSTWSGL